MSLLRPFGKLTLFCRREHYFGEGIELFAKVVDRREGEARVWLMQPASFQQLTDEQVGQSMPPALRLMPEESQMLMDELWSMGFRPTEGTGSAGSLAATQRHLEDLRHLVFKTKPKTP